MAREKIILICDECLSRNYQVYKSTGKTTKLEVKKYCPHCNKHTLHKETR